MRALARMVTPGFERENETEERIAPGMREDHDARDLASLTIGATAVRNAGRMRVRSSSGTIASRCATSLASAAALTAAPGQ
jgi:hypothetical protein